MGRFEESNPALDRRANVALVCGRLSSMKTAPSTPEQLRAALVSLFPAFDEDTSFGREITFHSLMFDFTPFYGKNKQAFSDKQWRGFAKLIYLAIQVPGPLENAVSTCFLEATRRDRALRAAIVGARSNTAGG